MDLPYEVDQQLAASGDVPSGPGNVVSIRDKLQHDFIRIGMSPHDVKRARDQFVSELVANFDRAINKPNILKESEFDRYIPLYSRELFKKARDHEVSDEEVDMIAELSQEFYTRIVPTQPLYIVADNDSQQIILKLPPIFLKANKNTAKMNQAITDFSTLLANDDGVNGGLVRTRLTQAMRKLWQTLCTSQDFDQVEKEYLEARKLRLEFNEQFGKDQNHPDMVKLHNHTSHNKPVVTNNPHVPANTNTQHDADDLVEFEDDEGY